jgi:hypothetical protein
VIERFAVAGRRIDDAGTDDRVYYQLGRKGFGGLDYSLVEVPAGERVLDEQPGTRHGTR